MASFSADGTLIVWLISLSGYSEIGSLYLPLHIVQMEFSQDDSHLALIGTSFFDSNKVLLFRIVGV